MDANSFSWIDDDNERQEYQDAWEHINDIAEWHIPYVDERNLALANILNDRLDGIPPAEWTTELAEELLRQYVDDDHWE